MHVEVTAAGPETVGADLVAVAPGPRARELGAPEGALADADPVAVVYREAGGGAPRLAVVAHAPDVEGLRTGAAWAVGVCREGGSVAWTLDRDLPVPAAEQVRALVEGAILGAYDGRRWRGAGTPPPAVERFVICDGDESLGPAAQRAGLVARWCNTARELVDAPPNLMSPASLADRATAVDGVTTVTVDASPERLPALAAVGAGSAHRPRLIVMRHQPPGVDAVPQLALIGKAVTFDSGGYFLKPQSDIVRMKADMAGGAAVVAAMGAIAELGLPLSVTGIIPACENMLSATATRPSDVIRTAAGLTVEVTNPDAEGRLILADALTWARREGATHIVDLATLTGAVRAGMGDVYAGVFGRDEAWRDAVVDAGSASGDLAWPWPLHRRYRAWLDSRVADLRNTAGRNYGLSIFAATFLAQFAGEEPWAHVDMLGPAFVDEDRGDGLGAGATGYGVRMLTELATRMSAGPATGSDALGWDDGRPRGS